MAKRRKKHVIEYDAKLDKQIPDHFEVEPLDNRDRILNYYHNVTPSRPYTARVIRNSHHIEIDLDDDTPLSNRELDYGILDAIDRQASRKRRIRPELAVRDLRPCEGAKKARRAAAFASGAAGTGKRTKPKRRYKC